MASSKTVQTVVKSQNRPHWVGNGFHVYPLFADKAFTPSLSPFLMFDYAPPAEFPPTNDKLGVGMHPHRGFETITIALAGEVEHRDSEGHTGVIGEGDVQWMTAGSGVFHEEFHSRKFAATGGQFSMMQLWVNLPAKLKMTPPRYQAILAQQITVAPLPNNAGTVRVIAGSFNGNVGPAVTDFAGEDGAPLGRGHIDLWEIILEAGKTTPITVPEGHTTLLFVRKGSVTVGDTELTVPRIAVMTREGSSFELTAGEEDASVFLLGGAPIVGEDGEVEPVVQHGPMVMNTNEEIREAMAWARSVRL